MKKICYWAGVIDLDDLANKYQESLARILQGGASGLNLEKLRGHDVYSVRLNRSDRLLFTTIQMQGKAYLMVLDVVENHDYQKSRFLKPGVLRNYLELQGKTFAEEINHEDFVDSELPESLVALVETQNPFADSACSLTYSRVEFFNQNFIEFSEEQSGLVHRTKLPLMISGVAGSGKSCVGLSMLENYIALQGSENTGPILYVTESSNLTMKMRRAWTSLPIAQQLDSKLVQFKCYGELVKELLPSTKQMIFVGRLHCLDYLQSRYVPKYLDTIKALKAQGLPDTLIKDVDTLYQEFRIISGCEDKAAYLSLGERGSLISDNKHKAWVFSAYSAYVKYLESEKSVHTSFLKIPTQQQFKLIVVDEAQDCSHLQLKSLYDLAINAQICYCEDNRQSLSDNLPKSIFLHRLISTFGHHKMVEKILSYSFRCPEPVVVMANAISRLKAMATNSGEKPLAVVPELKKIGSVFWHSPKLEPDQQLHFRQAAQSPDFVIVTRQEFKNEAEYIFSTPLVFTVEEIKGLEYRTVVAYRLLDAAIYGEINNEIVKRGDPNRPVSENRAKKGLAQDQYGPPLNLIYTAFTRSTDTLIIIQDKSHRLRAIIDILDAAMPKNLDRNSASLSTAEKTEAIHEQSRW